MASRLRIQEFMVLRQSGVPLFHFSPDNTKKLDELLSGFLTAITSFATEFGERSVQSLSFEGSELLYEQTDSEVIFILLVDSGAPKKVLRVVLRDLSKKFLERYSKELSKDIQIAEDFESFDGEVRRAFGFYEGILMITSGISPFVVPSLKNKAFKLGVETGGLLDQFHRDFGSVGERILSAIDGKTSIYDIEQKFGIEEDIVIEVIDYLAIWGVLKIFRMCPSFKNDDSRFDAYLDIVGLPRKEYQLLKRAKPLCNGRKYIVDVSEKLGVTAERLYEVLTKLGDEVEWSLVELVGLPAK